MNQPTLSAEQARVLAKGPFPDYPFTPKAFVHPSGLTQSYLDEGEGDPVVMLHGNPSWSYYWRHLVLGLRDDYRCIVPDHIGMGLSDKPADAGYRYTLRNRVQDLDRLLDHLGLGPTTRASFAAYNTHAEVERLIAGVAHALEILK